MAKSGGTKTKKNNEGANKTVTVQTAAGPITGSGPVLSSTGRGTGNKRVKKARETNTQLDNRLRRRSRGSRNATRE